MTIIKQFFKSHIVLFTGIGLCIVLLLTGSVIKSNAEGRYRDAQDNLNNLKNQLSQSQQVVENKRIKTVYSVSGLDLERVNADSAAALSWITPAFTFKNVDEYNEHRASYVALLGEDDDFVTAIMPPYIASTDDDGNTIEKVFNMQIKEGSFTPYVAKIDESTGVYTYVAFFTTQSDSAAGYQGSGEQRVIITYTMGDDHQLHDFKCQIESAARSY